MLWFSKHRFYPIGVDASDNVLRVAQLFQKDGGVQLYKGGSENVPEDVVVGSPSWQKWAIENLKGITADKKFKGKKVISMIPPCDIFIEHMKMPSVPANELSSAVISKIDQKLPFESKDAITKCIPTENGNLMVLAAERKKIERHLAIFEKAHLAVQQLSTWPTALASVYATFFGRRKSDLNSIVLLLDTNSKCTNLVFCRHQKLLFARSLNVGAEQLEFEERSSRLVMEIAACRGQFTSLYPGARIDRLIFLSGHTLTEEIYGKIAGQVKIPAQLGDCLTAVQIKKPLISGIERRGCNFSWAAAFGLSLSQNQEGVWQ